MVQPPRMPTDREADELIAAHRRMAVRLRRDAEELLRQAEWHEHAISMIESAGALTSETEPTTVTAMTATVAIDANALRSRARMSAETKDHPFIVAVKKRGHKLGAVAAWLETRLKRRVPRNTLQCWYRPATDRYYRPIPRDAAEAIRARYQVPLSAWPRITD